jgi:hypothetical protein
MKSVLMILFLTATAIILTLAFTACGKDETPAQENFNHFTDRQHLAVEYCNLAVSDERNPHRRRDFYDGCVYGYMFECLPQKCRAN